MAIEIQLIAILVAINCALLGCFLMLRRMAMMTDAISHAILPGIVIGFFFVHDLSSPWLIFGAVATGLLTVWLIESINQSGNLREDAAIGLVFPALFSIGVLLISRHAGDVHLDLDAVLMGELAFAPFDRWSWGTWDLGPRSMWVMAIILVVNLLVVGFGYKALLVSSFDPMFAALSGLSPIVLHYLLMSAVSVTVVGAFDAVGSILVIALFIAPPASANLWTDRLLPLMVLSIIIGAFSAVLGYQFARMLDVNIAGAMATTTGLMFAGSFLFAPQRGLVSQWRQQRIKSRKMHLHMLLVHILHHSFGERASEHERQVATLHRHLTWSPGLVRDTILRASRGGFVTENQGVLQLTQSGRVLADRAIEF